MTRDEVKEIIMIMTYTYPNYKPTDIKATVDIWASILAPFPFEGIKAALHAYILSDTKGFAPSPGQLVDQIQVRNFDMTELEAWGLVNKALSNSNYHAKEEFDKLPPLIQKTLGRCDVLKEWAIMEMDTVQSVIQSNFIRNYRTVLQRERDTSKLPVKLRKLLETTGAKMSEKGYAYSRRSEKILNGERFPKIKERYIKAFDEMLAKRREKGKDDTTGAWVDGKAVYRWWIEDATIPGQIEFDFSKIEKEQK